MPSFFSSRGFHEQYKIGNVDNVNNVGIKGVPIKFLLPYYACFILRQSTGNILKIIEIFLELTNE